MNKYLEVIHSNDGGKYLGVFIHIKENEKGEFSEKYYLITNSDQFEYACLDDAMQDFYREVEE